jgi:hypothetical protein
VIKINVIVLNLDIQEVSFISHMTRPQISRAGCDGGVDELL